MAEKLHDQLLGMPGPLGFTATTQSSTSQPSALRD